MPLVYFDSSALVKLVVDEDGSAVASALWDGCDAALSSRLAHPEVAAALAAARRHHDLDRAGLAAAAQRWDALRDALRPVEFTPDVERLAGDLARRRALRGVDAVHLASALALGTRDLVVAVWHPRLHEAAAAERLMVAPAALAW